MPAVTSTPSLRVSVEVLRSGVRESRSSDDILTSPHHPVQPTASVTEVSCSSSAAVDKNIRRDSGVCLQDCSAPTVALPAVRSKEDGIESELESAATESIASSVSTDQARLSPRKKKKRGRHGRMLSRLRNNNKVLPSMDSSLCSSGLVSKPPLRAPWLTKDTELPCEIVPSSPSPGASERDHTGIRILRLPPLASELIAIVS